MIVNPLEKKEVTKPENEGTKASAAAGDSNIKQQVTIVKADDVPAQLIDLKERIDAKKSDYQSRLAAIKGDYRSAAKTERERVTKKLAELDEVVKAGGERPNDEAISKIKKVLTTA